VHRMDGDAAPDPTLSPEQEQEIRAQVREAQQGRRKRGRAETVAQREQERSAYDPLAQHLGPDLTQMCRELQRLEALLPLGFRPPWRGWQPGFCRSRESNWLCLCDESNGGRGAAEGPGSGSCKGCV